MISVVTLLSDFNFCFALEITLTLVPAWHSTALLHIHRLLVKMLSTLESVKTEIITVSSFELTLFPKSAQQVQKQNQSQGTCTRSEVKVRLKTFKLFDHEWSRYRISYKYSKVRVKVLLSFI